jgi:hypothetical protein
MTSTTSDAATVEPVETLLTALDAQWAPGLSVTESDLSRPSRCPGWSVFDLLNHSVTGKSTDFAPGAADRSRSSTGDLVRPRPDRALRIAADSARPAWLAADMSRVCHLPFGTFPARAALPRLSRPG